MLSKICCLNTDFCKCQCLTLTRNQNIKLGYVTFIVLAFIILTITFQSPSQSTINSYACQGSSNVKECVYNKNAVILNSAIALLHLFLFCCMLCKSQKIKVINEGLWLIKLLFIALLAFALRLLVGTSLIDFLVLTSVWLGNILYIFEAIVFIDLVYLADSNLDNCAQENNKIYIFKAVLSVITFCAAVMICILSFQRNQAYIAWTNAVLLLIFVVLALLRVFQSNSILVASSVGLVLGTVGFYIEGDISSSFLMIIKILFVLFLLLGMLCQGSNKLRTRKSSLNELLALNTGVNEQDNRYVASSKWAVYHFIMILIILGIPTALWVPSNSETESAQIWLYVNNYVWWISLLLCYLWSLAASRIFPQRDFSDLENYFREYELQ